MNSVNPISVNNVLNSCCEAGKAPMETFCKDLFNNTLLPMLGSRDLVALLLASKTMCLKTKPALWARRRAEITIGPKRWESVGFEVTKVPPLPDDIDDILKSACPYFEGKRVYQTHKLILIREGLSINKQGELMRHLRKGDAKTVFHPCCSIHGIRKLACEELSKSYWVLVTTAIIPKSLGYSDIPIKGYESTKLFSEQQKLIKRGYEVTSILEVITLVTMDKKFSSRKEEYLLSNTRANCLEKITGLKKRVGSFNHNGLFLADSNFCSLEKVGILAVRRFY